MNKNWLLACLPAAVALDWYEANPILVFLVALLAIVPLAELMGEATEELATFLGPAVGGLLNASLNNAPEIILSLFALKNGLGDVVKASITGAILANLLFGLGLAMLCGGLKFGIQRFETSGLQLNSGLLTLAAFGLVVPAVFKLSSPSAEAELSREIAVVLLLIYLANVGYTLLTRTASGGDEAIEEGIEAEAEAERAPAPASRVRALAVLALATLGVAVLSEILSNAIEPTSKLLGFSPVFSGIILLAWAGGVGEILNALRFARKDRLDLAMGITIGSSIQMILLVAPILILAAPLLGQSMNLLFTPFEVAATVLAVVATRTLTGDGRSNWLEGLMLMAVYLMLALGFYHLPTSAGF